MEDCLKRLIIIKTQSHDEEWTVMEKIHNQLVGSADYKENRVILNDSSTRGDGTVNEVHVYIFKDAEKDWEFTI